MWNWFNCYLSGRHEYGMWCEPGAIFLRCIHCGRRSPGWNLEGKASMPVVHPKSRKLESPSATASANASRVVPFGRRAAR
jgi:hypothetical protein